MVDTEPITAITTIGLAEGDRYIAFRKIQGLGTSAQEDILIRNPSGSGVIVAIDAPITDTTARVETELRKNVSVSDPGTSITPRNARVGYSDDATALVNQDVTYTGGTLINDSFAGSGGGGSNAVAGDQSGIGLLLEPDNNVHLTVVNETNSSVDRVHLEIDFTEVKESLFPPSQ